MPAKSSLVLAFFASDFVVDASGRVLQLTDGDQNGLKMLIDRALGDDVPKPGGYGNQWRIQHPRTSMPILWLKVPGVGEGNTLKEVSIYGYSAQKRKLSKSVDGLSELLDVLQELFGVLDEARLDDSGGEGNVALAEQVGKMVDEV